MSVIAAMTELWRLLRGVDPRFVAEIMHVVRDVCCGDTAKAKRRAEMAAAWAASDTAIRLAMAKRVRR